MVQHNEGVGESNKIQMSELEAYLIHDQPVLSSRVESHELDPLDKGRDGPATCNMKVVQDKEGRERNMKLMLYPVMMAVNNSNERPGYLHFRYASRNPQLTANTELQKLNNYYFILF